MAMVIPGKTSCVLCKKPIAAADEAVAFPPFIPKKHSLAIYSDAAFHRSCFDEWDGHDELQRLYDRYREIWESRPEELTTMAEIEAWGKNAFRELFDDQS